MNELVYSGLSILELSKILMYEFWYDYVKPEYHEKNKIVLYGYRHSGVDPVFVLLCKWRSRISSLWNVK